MKTVKTSAAIALACAAPIFTACNYEGPAERAGKQLDKPFHSERDGPFEHSGKQLDKATDPKTTPPPAQ